MTKEKPPCSGADRPCCSASPSRNHQLVLQVGLWLPRWCLISQTDQLRLKVINYQSSEMTLHSAPLCLCKRKRMRMDHIGVKSSLILFLFLWNHPVLASENTVFSQLLLFLSSQSLYGTTPLSIYNNTLFSCPFLILYSSFGSCSDFLWALPKCMGYKRKSLGFSIRKPSYDTSYLGDFGKVTKVLGASVFLIW